MADIDRARELKGFFNTKTIQRAYNFFVTINNDDSTKFNQHGATRLHSENVIADMPTLEAWHVVDVTLQNYAFKKEVIKFGTLPRSFPVLDFDGFEITVTFEEDEKGTIAYFINWLQQRIIKPNGIYRFPDTHKLDLLKVEIKENFPHEATGKYETVVTYNFPKVYFLKGDQAGPLGYGASESIKYAVTFGADSMEQEFKNFNR